MTAPTPLAGIADLAPVGLDELDATAALLDRRERKYVVPRAGAEALVAAVGDAGRVLEVEGRRAFRYESVYFDTPELVCFQATARRRPRRFKVRTRTYADAGLCQLEVKQRDRVGRTVKHRVPHAAGDRRRLTGTARRYVATFEAVAPHLDALRPVLTTTYLRSTLLLPAAGARVTLDLGLECRDEHGGRLRLADRVLVETKSPGPPTPVDRWLWRAGHRPVAVSKYGTGLAALHPELSANRWHRTLARHFHPDPTRFAP